MAKSGCMDDLLCGCEAISVGGIWEVIWWVKYVSSSGLPIRHLKFEKMAVSSPLPGSS